MNPPFSREEFFNVFAAYNGATWPVQILLVATTLGVLVLAAKDTVWRGRVVAGWLAVLWGWMALVYHWSFFAPINPAARLFAGLFLVQAVLFTWFGFRPRGLRFAPRDDLLGYAGGFLVTYALFAYPLIGIASGQTYPHLPSFGLPCPTTIFTIGVLLWAAPRTPWTLLVIPALWAIVALSAALSFGVTQDLMLPASVLIAAAALLSQRRGKRGTTPQRERVGRTDWPARHHPEPTRKREGGDDHRPRATSPLGHRLRKGWR